MILITDAPDIQHNYGQLYDPNVNLKKKSEIIKTVKKRKLQ